MISSGGMALEGGAFCGLNGWAGVCTSAPSVFSISFVGSLVLALLTGWLKKLSFEPYNV